MIPNTYIREIVASTNTTAKVADVTDEQIEALKADAIQAGDMDMVVLCKIALDDGDVLSDVLPADARTECTRAIAAAAAMH